MLAFTPETNGFLAQAGLKWTADVTYADLPIQIHTPHGIIAGVPTSDFADNRTRLKVLTGNPGKRPLNAAELTPEPAIPDCPAELGPVARREWDRLVGELASLRLLTNLDRAALAAYCGAYAGSRTGPESTCQRPLGWLRPDHRRLYQRH